MTKKEIGDQMEERLQSYRHFYLSDLDDKNATLNEQKRLEQQSKVAWDTLQAAFGDKKILTEKVLNNKSVGAEDRIREWLQDWTEELESPDNADSGGWFETAETCEQCIAKTRSFLSRNLWPFIRVIRRGDFYFMLVLPDEGSIYLDADVLKTGTILVDLPGV